MKKISSLVLVIFAVLLLGSCATTDVKFEDSFLGIDTGGEINILLSRAVPQLTLIMDDRILIDARWTGTRRVNVKNVPIGQHTLKMFANSWQLKENFKHEGTVEVKNRGDFPLTFDVPQYSTMYWIYTIGLVIVSAFPSVVVYY